MLYSEPGPDTLNNRLDEPPHGFAFDESSRWILAQHAAQTPRRVLPFATVEAFG
jgi:hypothetical protein